MEKSTKGNCEVEASCNTTEVSSELYFKCHNWLEKIAFNTICYLEAAGSYCRVHISNNKKLTIARPLSDIINSLPSDTFIRVHRSYAINIKYVNKYCRNVFYIQETMIPIGRAYKKEALSHFNIVTKGK